MTIAFPAGSAGVVTRYLLGLLQTHAGGYLATAQTAMQASGVLVVLPPPVALYAGVVEDRQGDYPALGVFVESMRLTPLVTSEYMVEYRVAVTAALTARSLEARAPSDMYLGAQAYIGAAVECLATRAAREGVPLGIYGSEALDAAAERSPHVVQTTSETHYETRRAIGRVRILQTLDREVPL